MGHSDQHARSVSSVLSLTTGLVSAQFHVTHDDFFETVSLEEKSTQLSSWMVLAGLKRGNRVQCSQSRHDTAEPTNLNQQDQVEERKIIEPEPAPHFDESNDNDLELSRINDMTNVNHEDQEAAQLLGRGY